MKILHEANISLEAIFILAGGLMMFVLGVVLLLAAGGLLPYYQHGMYGLLLIICGLQLQTVGKTPIRYTKRSWPVLILGVIITIIGFAITIVPEMPGDISKILVILFFGVGGVLLLFELFYSKEMYPLWKMLGARALTHLIYSCAAVYILMILIAVVTGIQLFQPGIIPTELLAVFALLFGITLFYLAIILQKVDLTRLGSRPESDMSICCPCMSLSTVMEVQYGFFMLVSGILLALEYYGLLPFADSAQLGVMVLLLGVQALVVGNMLTLQFIRSWMVISVGMVLVAVGTFAIIVPDMLFLLLALFIAFFNIIGGFYLFYSLIRPKPMSEKATLKPEGKDILLLIFLLVLAVLTAILMILVGVLILIIDQIPGVNFAISLAFFGLTLFVLFYVRSIAEKKQLIEKNHQGGRY